MRKPKASKIQSEKDHKIISVSDKLNVLISHATISKLDIKQGEVLVLTVPSGTSEEVRQGLLASIQQSLAPFKVSCPIWILMESMKVGKVSVDQLAKETASNG